MKVELELRRLLGPKLGGLKKVDSWASEVYATTWAGESAFLKVDKRNFFPTEIAICKLLRGNGIPAPKLLKYEKSGYNGRDVMVLAAVPGRKIGARTGLAAPAGQMLKRIHSIPMGGFGELVLEKGEVRGTRDSWKDYLAHHYGDPETDQTYRHVVESNILTSADVDRVQLALKEAAAADRQKPVFLHNDYHGDHVFSDGHRITGLIDFEKSLAGDPLHDLARALYFQDREERQAFIDGYGGEVEVARTLNYMILIAAGKIRWVYGSSINKLKKKMLRRFRETIAYVDTH